ncbi:MFS transporter [Pseudoroseomonas rhizosphaerae]|uniref:MFS transporter n=1 Tax=Teichococcus rhizosphaerae TaxID=1335062 RepID=A0A2C7A6I3_9PROT|nr:MFS transporter [Pseudoroseomonas rhizosphaerae]PHK92925.1 MFS transporter [Pseudoroseomonas rhizosphaerae]
MSQATMPGRAPAGAAADRRRLTVVSAIGVGQILAWGSSYYLLAVLAGPIAADTGWPLTWIMGALSIGMLVSGLASPRVGHLIDRHGGRPVLAASAVLLSAGLLLLGLAPSLPVFVVAWVVLGLAMGAGLYDPAFSTLGRLYGEQARSAITHVTLFGGFASTVCWPLSAILVDQLGWRGACLTYAAVHLAVVLPLYLFGVPREAAKPAAAPAAKAAAVRGHMRAGQRYAFVMLAAGFTLAAVIMTVLSVHLLTLLQSQGLALAAAVALGTLIGPAQVGARVLEMLFGKKAHPIWSLLASAVLVAVGLGMLVGAPGVVAAGIIMYGMGSGIRSIARGTVPLALFGKEGYAVLMGRIAMPTLVAQAASPFLGAWLLDGFGASTTLAVLCGAAVLNILMVLALLPVALKPGSTAPATT